MSGKLRHRLLVLLGLLVILLPVIAAPGKVIELNVNGAIGPATADYLSRAIHDAQNGTGLILIQLDTPGGLDKSTRQIVLDILSSKVPVVTYVSPNGARAASAGTFLLYASTVAAMAPSTHLGAASPVNLLGDMDKTDKTTKQKSTMEKKVTNDAVAYIRSLAQLRDRDAVFAQKAILDAATLTANEALKAGVINIVAKNRADLLTQLNGLIVVQDNQRIQLNTKEAQVESITPDWRTRFLQIITEPTVAYLLLLLGIYGIFFELMNPGFMLPGVVGAVAILLALYALQLLPVNYAGLGLIILGIILITAEAFTPSFGTLGLGGTVSFIIGSVLLIDSDHTSYQIAWSAIWAMAAVNVVFIFALFTIAIKSRKQKIQHGVDILLGAEGRTLGIVDPCGQAVIRGEIWSVHASQPIPADKRVRVVATKGLQLQVEEINHDADSNISSKDA
ncbi:TPA: nodulation protein NfeD [Legionella feeleii]